MKNRNEQTDELEEWEEGGYEKPMWIEYEKTPEPLRNAECGSRSEEKVETTNEHEQTRTGSEPPALAGGQATATRNSNSEEVQFAEPAYPTVDILPNVSPPADAGGSDPVSPSLPFDPIPIEEILGRR